jgi:hypothetical protein
VFERDRAGDSSARFPGLRLATVRPFMPLAYLASGGVGMRSLMPGFSYPLWRGLERMAGPLERSTAMFALIVVESAGRTT